MKNKRYHTCKTVPKSNRQIVERCKIDTHLTAHVPVLLQALE